MDEAIERFLDGGPFAVVGASKDRTKYGNKVLRCYGQNGRLAYGVHPKETEIEGRPCVSSLAELPETVHGVSVITPPPITDRVMEDVVAAGIRHVWIQPGAESEAAIQHAEENGVEVIHGGPCLLVVLGYREA